MKPTARQARLVGGFDFALTLVLIVASFEPLRSRIGRATGLWHPCAATGGAELWSPVLLLITILPIALGFVVARSAPAGKARVLARLGAVSLLVVTLFMVAFPTGSCEA
jgi:hypothetical protein